MSSEPAALVVTADPDLTDQMLSVAAAAGATATVVDARHVRPLWNAAGVVVVGADQAEELVVSGPTHRPGVYVVGGDGRRDELCRWSTPLGAAVAVLPDAAAWLTSAFADASGLRGQGRLVGVMGGSGGVGASTIAAALAVAAARSGLRPVLVDLDPAGGGLDLLLGAEQVDGWRWPRLSGARGHLGDLSGQLPRVDGVDVLSVARGRAVSSRDDVGAEQLASVLRSTTQSHDLTVVDLPRAADRATAQAIRRLELLVVVVRADVRGVASAQHTLERLAERPALGLVVRTRRIGRLRAQLVADRLGAPLLGTMIDDWSLRLAADRGDPPGRSARSPIARLGAELIDVLAARSEAA